MSYDRNDSTTASAGGYYDPGPDVDASSYQYGGGSGYVDPSDKGVFDASSFQYGIRPQPASSPTSFNVSSADVAKYFPNLVGGGDFPAQMLAENLGKGATIDYTSDGGVTVSGEGLTATKMHNAYVNTFGEKAEAGKPSVQDKWELDRIDAKKDRRLTEILGYSSLISGAVLGAAGIIAQIWANKDAQKHSERMWEKQAEEARAQMMYNRTGSWSGEDTSGGGDGSAGTSPALTPIRSVG